MIATMCSECGCGWYDASKPVGGVCGDAKANSSECRGELVKAPWTRGTPDPLVDCSRCGRDSCDGRCA